MERAATAPTATEALWQAIAISSRNMSFERYASFIDHIMAGKNPADRIESSNTMRVEQEVARDEIFAQVRSG